MRRTHVRYLTTALALAAGAGLAAPTMAEVRTWIAATGGGLTDPANWSGGLVPGEGDSGLFDLGATYTVTLSANFTTDQFRIGADDVTLDLGASTLTLARDVGLADPSLALGLEVGQSSSLTLNSGSMTSQVFSAGRAEGSQGEMTVTGATTEWLNNSTFAIGDQGAGSLSILDGSRVLSGPARIGLKSTGDGSVSVSGAGTEWINGFSLRIGVDGLGAVTVATGARAEATIIEIGFNADGDGSLLATGAGAVVAPSGALNVGRNGMGDLRIEAGAAAESLSGGIALNGGSLGDAVITGLESVWSVTNTLTVGGNGVGGLTIEQDGRVAAGSVNVATGAGMGDITVTTNGVLEAEFSVGVGLGSGGVGSVTLDSGSVMAPTVTIGPSGQLSGVGTVAAKVINAGFVRVGNPTGVLLISGSFEQNTELGGAVVVSLAPTTTALGVSGEMLLDGRLTVNLAPGFTPSPGDEFLVLGAQSRTGEFQTVQLPPPGGGVSYSLEYRDALVVVVANPTPDINGDGVVDGNDLGLLLGAWGTNDNAADINGDGVVDGADLGILLGAWTG